MTDRRDPTLAVLSLVAVIAIFLGIWALRDTDLASTWPAALAGVASQLPVTLPAAGLVLGAAALQLAAGSVALRALRGAPYPSVVDAVLGGFVGAVLIGLASLMLLGSLAVFRLPVVGAINVAVLGVGWWRMRPILASAPRFGIGQPLMAAVLVVFAWSGSVMLQLASPVVPFIDVLPNHVAPAEHLRAFGAFEVLTTAPSPIYGPSRMFLGYTGLLGTTTVLTGLPAGLAVAAFILPSTVLVGAGMARLGSALHGRGMGWWMLVAFVLTTSFSRLTDARATVVVLPVVAFCVAELLAVPDPANPRTARRAAALAAGLAVSVYLHPLIGALTVATVTTVVALRPDRHAEVGIPGLAGAVILSVPQAATMLGVALPSVLGLLAIPAAAAVAWLLLRAHGYIGWVVLGLRIGLAGSGVAFVVLALTNLVGGGANVGGFLLRYPVLASTAVVGVLVARRRTVSQVVVVALVMGPMAVTAAAVLTWAGLGIEGLDFELAKTLHYWIPVFLAVMGAAALRTVWEHPSFRWVVRTGVMGVFLLAATLPIRGEPLEAMLLGEHRVSETLSIDLQHAEHGFWSFYPDSRYVMDPPRTEIVERLQEEVRAGRLAATTSVLHIAFDFQQWAATPVGVFGGMVETMVSMETEVSSHTAGGRLHPFSELDTFLADAAAYPYLVLEPAHLPADTRDRVLSAGYEPIFANEQGEIFVLPGE